VLGGAACGGHGVGGRGCACVCGGWDRVQCVLENIFGVALRVFEADHVILNVGEWIETLGCDKPLEQPEVALCAV
jgi:hypothetical protein